MFSTRINRLFVRLTTIELLFLMFSGECRLLGSEPIYQGEPESYWVDLLANLDSAPFATQWQTLGSNTIPVFQMRQPFEPTPLSFYLAIQIRKP